MTERSDNTSLKNIDINVVDDTEKLLEKTRPFMELMMQYKCALKEVTTKFEVLNEEFSVKYNRNPVESIKTRLKKPLSIVEKLKRKGLPMSVDSMRYNINDIAGVRIICSFPKDIYDLADMFLRQDDVRLIEKKDYIKNPKPNGYRSLHLIIEIPIFLTQRTEYMRVEVQLRTIAMDFWASLEHKVKYKKNIKDEKLIGAELKLCAEIISKLDIRMQAIHEHIEDRE